MDTVLGQYLLKIKLPRAKKIIPVRDRYIKSAGVAVALLEKLHLKTSKKLVSGFKLTICCILSFRIEIG